MRRLNAAFVLPFVITALASGITVSASAAESPEAKAVHEKTRAAIPLGGNFEPAREEGVFVAAGHGLNVVASRDDGKTWRRVFYGAPCGDHGYWAVWNSVAYTNGVFAVAAGWGAPGTIIASDDGEHWRHLTDGTRPSQKGGKPYDMRTTMQFIGANGAFVMPFESTTDFGRTWHVTSPYRLTDKDGNKVKVDVGHPSLAFGAGRVIVVGEMGPSLYSDDLGRTWLPLRVEVSPWEEAGARGILAKDDVFLLLKGSGDTVLRSDDKGLTWTAHPLGVKNPAGRSYSLSVVGDEFWITGTTSKASKDGITWRELPKSTPVGRIAASDQGTLINVDRKRNSILRSADGGATWTEVYKYEPDPTASGGAQGLADVEFGYVRKLAAKDSAAEAKP